MGQKRSNDETDAYVQGLRSIYEAVGREFDVHDAKAQRIETRIETLRAELEALQAEKQEAEERAGQFSSFGIQIEDALRAALDGDEGKQELAVQVSRMSRHGPVGIRAPILEIMAQRSEDSWSPGQVRSELALRGIVKTGRNVGQTMRNMVADGQLERAGRRAAYRLPSGGTR